MAKSFFLVIFLSFAFTSCDPAFYVDFIIQNNTSDRIYIEIKSQFMHQIDTNTIANHTKLTFLTEGGLGYRSKYLDDLKIVPVDTILIWNAKNQKYKLDAMNVQNWNKSYMKQSGEVMLNVHEDDFQ